MNMDYIKRIFCLDGKKAIVTGGNSGIGMGIAKSLASLGVDVTIIGRDPKSIEEVTKELVALGTKSKGYPVDLMKKEAIDAFFDKYYAENDGKLDILVANAGISVMKRALDTTSEEMDRLFNTNLKGTMFCCQRAAEAMKKQNSGNIVITTSVNALYPLPPQAVYTSTKIAEEALMQCLAVDLAPFGIRVNTIAPGAIISNLGRDNPNPRKREGDWKKMPGLPLGRIGEPDDIGDVVACMVTDAFRYQTGSTVLVDGGLKLRNV
ncbi:MAG: SDR family oxidoreductase [Treponema sp.]|jgi:NAD(P)-dependent dehydrogenase (short-subunit alcohol dehydrogenase family)|nr:SDR family oxidoreductase [Treponema sp.]